MSNQAYNLRKHPELFYLGDNTFHVCPKCNIKWECLTIQNYGNHDQSEFIDICYKCKKANIKQNNLGKLPRFIVRALIKSNSELKAYAKSLEAKNERMDKN